MCDVIITAQTLSRRGFIGAVGAVGLGAATTGAAPAAAVRLGDGDRQGAAYRTRLVLLGVGAGPVWANGVSGIGSAVVVDGDVYVVDCGEGVWHQLKRANLSGSPESWDAVARLRGVFLTHLHSDHIVDYNNLLLFAISNGLLARTDPVRVYGPGNRGSLPPVFGPPGTPEPPVVSPENPTPGTEEMTWSLFEAYAQDLNDRIRAGTPDPRSRIVAHDIPLPDHIVAGANTDPAPTMEPIDVFEDAKLRVSAILVNHRPTFPAFAFRFDTEDGSIVFSGDTAPDPNLVRLAQGADLLVHECIDRQWVESLFPDPSDPIAAPIIDHLLESHTTIEQVGPVAEQAGVKTLVLSHLAPAHNPRRRWQRARKGFSGRLVVGEDLLALGVGNPRRRRI